MWVGERIGHFEWYTTYLKIKIILNVYAINYRKESEIFISHLFYGRNGHPRLFYGRNSHFSPVFSFLICFRVEMDISYYFHKIRLKCEIFSPTFTREKGRISCLSWEKNISPLFILYYIHFWIDALTKFVNWKMYRTQL